MLFGFWLLAVAALMFFRPQTAREALGAMASTPLIHFGEHALRFVAGVAFVVAAERSRYPDVFRVFGGFMAVTSVLVVLAPRRWHQRYAEFWAAKLEPRVNRVLSPLTLLFGVAVLWDAG